MDKFFLIKVMHNEPEGAADVQVDVSENMTSSVFVQMLSVFSYEFVSRLLIKAQIALMEKENAERDAQRGVNPFELTEPDRKRLVNRLGSVDDIRASLKVSTYSAIELKYALDDEMKRENRTSVVRLLEAAIKRKMREEGCDGK